MCKKKKVLVTGASGFIGSHVVEALIEHDEYDIHALSTGKRTTVYPEGVKPFVANLLDYKQTKDMIEAVRPDILISIAWDLTSGLSFKESSIHFDWHSASMNLLKHFVYFGGKHFIHHSSGSEYPAYTGHKEVPLENKLSLFGEAKHSFHKMAKAYCKLNGVCFSNTICYNSLGERIRSNAATFLAVKSFLDNKEFVCKSPYNIWDFTYAGDTVQAVVKVMRAEYNGAVNIGRGIPVAVGDMFDLISQIMNKTHLLIKNTANKRFEIIVPDVTVLNNEIKYICQTSLERSIEITVDWVCKHINARSEG